MKANYKEIALRYISAVNNYNVNEIRELVNEDYIQHNPFVPTGREAFISFLPKLKEYQSKIENYRMLSDGKYIIMHHLWHNADPFGAKEMVAFHIIRFDDSDKIAEHWNVISPDSKIEGDCNIVDLEQTTLNKLLITENLNHSNRKLHCVFGEGNFVLSISEYEQTAFYNLYNVKQGVAVNEWHVEQHIPTENLANTNTMFNF